MANPTHHVVPAVTKPLCTHVGDDDVPCQRPAICRGLCKPHWTYAWKNALLPPKQPKAPSVLVKIYLPKAQVSALKRLMRERQEKMSTLLRGIIDAWLTENAGSGEED